MQQEFKELSRAIEVIYERAQEFGLDFFPMRFELVPADVIYAFGAYGMPTRFAHWTFGKHFYKMKLQYDYNLSRIYEMVINSNPCYAFLLEGNDLIQNKMVIAHAFAHSDFFKNNCYFRSTSERMLESMAAHAARIREYESKYGRHEVEIFLDAALAIREHIEPPSFLGNDVEDQAGGEELQASRVSATPYEDLWTLDGKQRDPAKIRIRKIPPRPQKDLLAFISEHSPELESWQQDILAMLREEMRYFWPQLATKIINEGWATYWHTKIMRDIDLTETETVEFARLNADVLQPHKMQLNPYYIGSKIFADIERRWDNPTAEERARYGRQGGEGRAKIFEVRSCENDVSFLRNYLSRELVEELDLYLYQKVGSEWVVVEKDWEKVRDGLVNLFSNCGYPYIVVEDGDYQRRGELYLRHNYEGLELDVEYLEKTLPHVYLLWGRPVHLEIVVEGKNVVFCYDGKKNSRR